MNSSFGEIVEPGTRTAWEDWDEIQSDEQISVQLQWQNQMNVPNDIGKFLILEGKYLSDCVNDNTESKLVPIDSIPAVNLKLYKMCKSQTYICTIKDYNLLLSSEILELLRSYLLMSPDVITVNTKSLSEYQSSDTNFKDCIIRKISTSKTTTSKFNFPKLEQPNIITGISAGAISLREHLNMPATGLVCYMAYPEQFEIDEVQSLLAKLEIKQDFKPRVNTVLNSNLYI